MKSLNDFKEGFQLIMQHWLDFVNYISCYPSFINEGRNNNYYFYLKLDLITQLILIEIMITYRFTPKFSIKNIVGIQVALYLFFIINLVEPRLLGDPVNFIPGVSYPNSYSTWMWALPIVYGTLSFH